MGRFVFYFFTVLSITGSQADECSQLLTSVLNFRDGTKDIMVIENKTDEIPHIRKQVFNVADVDIEDEAAIQKVLCDSLDAQSAEELAAALKLKSPYRETFLELYDDIPKFLDAKFTPKQEYETVQQGLVFLEVTGFPNFPLDIGYDEAFAAFRELPREMFMFPYQRKVNDITDEVIDVYASALIKAHTVEEFAEMTDKYASVNDYKIVKEFNLKRCDVLLAAIDMKEAVKRNGLLNLPH